MDNMEIYNKVRAVPKEAQKSFNNGSFQGTDINPMFRIRVMTETFGPCGFGWKYTIEEHWNEEINGEIHTHVRINLYISKDGIWSDPIPGIGGNKSLQQFKSGPKTSDEGYKMALTDALSVAAKALGVGADIYWDSDKTKYQVQDNNRREAQQDQVKESVSQVVGLATAIKEVSEVKSYEELRNVWAKYKPSLGNNTEFKKAVAESPFNTRK